MSIEIPEINPEIIEKYSGHGPRYTSYPTAKQFYTGFNEVCYQEIAGQTNEDLLPKALSLYFHMPFCSTVCYYCACNKIITANRNHTHIYLKYLKEEIQLQSQIYDKDRVVKQLHLGGGTPTYFTPEQIHEFMQEVNNHFTLLHDDSGDYSIEVDPRQIFNGSIASLRKEGFNRLSIGLQDFNPMVQKAVNRIQSYEQTAHVIDQARSEGFHSINLDLIYGLPLQTIERFNQTLDQVIELNPDRIAIYHYAHLPQLFKSQKQINEDDLPSSKIKVMLLNLAIERLQQEGYVYIGMDHFAKPNDELYLSQQNGSLHRSFQGYTTHADCDVIGMGVTAISQVGNSYSQNFSTLEKYYSALFSGHLPIVHGYRLNVDDQLRRDIINRLMCQFKVNLDDVEDRYPIDFFEYFYNEIIELNNMAKDSLLEISNNVIYIHPVGRLLIRTICSVFDKFIHTETTKHYSKVI